MTCCSATASSCSLRLADHGLGGVPDVRGAPLDLLPLEAPGRPSRPGDAQAPRAPAAADAQPAAQDDRGAGLSLLDRSPRARAPSASPRSCAGRSGAAIVVSPERGVEGARPSRPEHPRQASRRSIAGYAAPYEPPRDPGPEQHIDVDQSRRAGRDRLLLRRATARTLRARSGSSPRSISPPPTPGPSS